MMRVPSAVDTPALVVDAERLDRNLATMAAAASTIALRPHAKTHKCVELARLQLAHGAVGLTVATLDEAEFFAAAGCDDLFIAYPLWAGGAREPRLRALHERVRLRVGVDNLASAQALAAVPGLEVLIEVDCGGRRSGVPASSVASLASACLRLGLDVVGAFTHPGHAYADPSSVAAAASDERAGLCRAGDGLAGLIARQPVLSGGSTPTALAGIASPLTEVRPGTYVFGDRQQMSLARVAVEGVALVVAARVVSAPRPGEIVLDAGSKALSSDRPPWLDGYGLLVEDPSAVIYGLTEEHAVVRGLRRRLAVGDLVQVVPNHVCPVVNLARELVVVSGDAIIDRWPVGGGRR